MLVPLTPRQRDLVLQLVDAAMDEIGPEIRHTFDRDYRDELKEQRRELRGLHDVLGTPDSGESTAPGIEHTSGMVGTP
jgi:hypothetical protein